MRRGAVALLVTAVAIHAILIASLVHPDHFLNPLFVEGVHNIGEGQGSDFYAFYQAGRYVLEGRDIYQRPMEDPNRVVPYGYFYRYLPFVAYTLGVAANAVPPKVAYWIWIGLVEAVLAWCVAATWRIVRDRSLFAALAAMWLMFTPFYIEQYMGQLTFVTAALVFAFALGHARGSMRLFDWSWIASVVVKHLTILFVPILLKMKRYRTMLLAASALIVTTVPYFLLRPVGLQQFTHDNFGIDLNPMPGNQGLLALIMVVKYHFFPSASEFFGSVWSLQLSWTRIILMLAGGVPTIVCLWATFVRKPFDFLESLALWTILYFFVFREVWEYHYVLLLPILVLVYARTRARVLWVIYGILAAPTLFVFYDVPGHAPEAHWSAFVHILNHGFKIAPVVGLFVWVASGCLRRHAGRLAATADSALAITF
jgi:hypothetical protein